MKQKADQNQPMLGLRGGHMRHTYAANISWRPTPIDQLPQDWSGARRVGFDTETKDSNIKELGPGVRQKSNFMIGYSFCLQDDGPSERWPRFYVPFDHGRGANNPDSLIDNVDKRAAIGYLTDRFRTYAGDVVGANLPYDLDWSMEYGVTFPCVKRFCDIQVADPLIYELHDKYGLEHIGERWGVGGKNETELRHIAASMGMDPKEDMWQLMGRAAGPYAEIDAVNPLLVYEQQLKKMEEDDILDCWDLECKVLPILVRMTRKGVKVNLERLAHVEEWCKRVEAEQCAEIERITSVPFPPGHTGDSKLLRRVLEAADLADKIGETSRGKDSFRKDIFAGVDHPVAKALARARQVVTIRNTFIGGVGRHVAPDGRIHCTFNQIRKTDDDGDESGVAYGRLSASHPNMQNQPGNSRFSGDNELGPMWRSIYEAEDGEEWWALDLKQQEPKWSFHYGALLERVLKPDGTRAFPYVRGALALCKKLCDDPTLDTYEPIVELAGVPRSKAKVIWLARAYGKGDGGLCRDLGYPTRRVCWSQALRRVVPLESPEGEAAKMNGAFDWEGAGEEGQAFIDKFELELSFLKESAKTAKKTAEARGYIKLLSGRRCHFEKGHDGKYQWCHKAFNRLIQGTSAEQTKRIMVAADEAGFGDTFMLQVHDEIDCSIGCEADGMRLASVMRDATPELLVPTVVDVERGPSWGESMMVEYNDCSGRKSKLQYKWGLHIVDGVPVYGENP